MSGTKSTAWVNVPVKNNNRKFDKDKEGFILQIIETSESDRNYLKLRLVFGIRSDPC